MTAIEVGDMVRILDIDPADWARHIGLVEEIEEVPEAGTLLTLAVVKGGQTWRLAGDVERIDTPRVKVGQVWTCDQTGHTVRVTGQSWLGPLVWDTETLAPVGRFVGTVALCHPAWRMVEDAPGRDS